MVSPFVLRYVHYTKNRIVMQARKKRGRGCLSLSGCYRHLGPKGPKSVGCDRLIATEQDPAILHYRFAVRLRCAATVGCDRLIATRQDRAILTYRERSRGPREKARGTGPRAAVAIDIKDLKDLSR